MRMQPTTRTISIRKFRENMSKLLREAQEKNVHFVIMRHAEPVAQVVPVSRKDSLEALAEEVAQAREDVRHGRVYTPDQVRAMLGL